MTVPHAKLSNPFLFFTKHKVWPLMFIPSQVSNFILSLVLHSCVLLDDPAYCTGHTSCSELLGRPPRISPSEILTSTAAGSFGRWWLSLQSLSGDFSQMKRNNSPKSHIPFPRTAYIQWLVERRGSKDLTLLLQGKTTLKSHPSFRTHEMANAFFVTILQPNTFLCLILLPSLPTRADTKDTF